MHMKCMPILLYFSIATDKCMNDDIESSNIKDNKELFFIMATNKLLLGEGLWLLLQKSNTIFQLSRMHVHICIYNCLKKIRVK